MCFLGAALVFRCASWVLLWFFDAVTQASWSGCCTQAKSLWPDKDAGAAWVNNQWEQPRSKPVAFDAVNSRQYYLENTFLYVDEVGHGGEGLCLAPSSPEPCPLGFVASDPSAASCALEARNNGIYTVDLNNDPSNPYQVTLNSKTGEIECWVLGSRLYRHGWGLYSQCKACLDIPQPASIDSLVSKWRGVNAWAGASVFVMAYSFSLPGASCWRASS